MSKASCAEEAAIKALQGLQSSGILPGTSLIPIISAILAAVAPLIAAAEREACARVCEAWADEVEAKAPQSPTIIQARNHAAAIRARGDAS
jgi:hypothetical protein